MRPCQNCLENNWKFKKLNTGWIQATCQLCAYEVEWYPVKKTKSKIATVVPVVRKKGWSIGKPCRNCKTPVILYQRKFNPRKFVKAWYYTAYYRCPKCKRNYYSDKFKIEKKTTVYRHVDK